MMTDPSAGPAVPAASNCWYIVHAYSGMEKAVERNLTERIDPRRHAGQFGRILVPTEEGGRTKNGKKTVRAPHLPGLCAGRDGDGRRHLAPGQTTPAR